MKLLCLKEVLWLSSGQACIRLPGLKEQLYILLLQTYWCSKFAKLFWDGKCLLIVWHLEDFPKYTHLPFQGEEHVLTKARN